MRPFIDKYLQVCYYENNQKIKRFMNNILKIDWFRPGQTIEELKNIPVQGGTTDSQRRSDMR